jgi:hypothetical protein
MAIAGDRREAEQVEYVGFFQCVDAGLLCFVANADCIVSTANDQRVAAAILEEIPHAIPERVVRRQRAKLLLKPGETLHRHRLMQRSGRRAADESCNRAGNS